MSHIHADHIGGLENFALKCKLQLGVRPTLIATQSLLDRLWNCSLKGSLEYVDGPGCIGIKQTLEDYFETMPIEPTGYVQPDVSDPFKLYVMPTNHVLGMESYGVELIEDENDMSKRLLFTSDTRFDLDLINYGIDNCSNIFHDCQLFDSGEDNILGVHTSYNQLLALPKEIRSKIWLYHYGDTPLPPAKNDGFKGFVCHLQSFEC